MAAQDYYGVVQQLYVSYFGRPADYFGQQNFANQLQAMNAPTTFAGVQAAVGADVAGTSPLSLLVNNFNTSAESIALYGNDNSQLGVSRFVSAVYQNVLGREADLEGFNFWVNAISTGSLSKANAAAAITQGALTNTSEQGLLDRQTVENKLAVATSFTAALDTPTEFNAYAGDAAAATGRSLLQGVNNTTNLTDYQSNIDDAISTIVNVAVPGNTVSLTVGVDTLTGTAGDDVFNAIPQSATGEEADTLGSFDTIDGGAGRDTLNIYTTGGKNATQQGTVKNVETINIYNQQSAGVFGGAAVDASKFVGVTNINQVGNVTGVTNLGAGTTATFSNASTAATPLVVGAADGASSVKVALNNVSGSGTPPGPGGTVNQATLNVSGAALSSVTVSGAVAQADPASTTAASLLLNVAAGSSSTGASVGTVTVNTAVDTTLTVTEGTANKSGNVTSVNAAASTGAITYVAAGTVSDIATGAGADTVTISYATTAAAGDVAAKNASVTTGAGDDTITVLTTGAGLTTVDAGAGADTINVTKAANAGLNIQGGEGDDTVVLQGDALATTDVLDGGAGNDVISIGGSATRRADDFIVFNKLIKNFETIKFSTAEGALTTALDTSLLGANYTSIDLATGSFIANVGAQNIVANGDLTASTTGYTAAQGDTKAIYGGTLNVTQNATGIITANTDVVRLTVAAGDSDVTATLAGDAKSAIVTLNNALNSAGDTDTVAGFSLTTATGTDAALTSLTLSGTGAATVINADGTALVNVDASALAGKFTVGDNAGKAADGLIYTSSNTAVETIRLGAGVDQITLETGASTYGQMDTITGLNLVVDAAGTGLAANSDSLTIAGVTGAVKYTTTQTDFDLALKDAAAYTTNGQAQETVVFAFGGDTYVYHDGGTAGSVDASDVVVKLTGAVDQDALVLALNAAP